MMRKRRGTLSENYVEEVYAVLKSWGMNSRGARLADFKKMKASILKNKEQLETLSKLKMEKVATFSSGIVYDQLRHLYDCLVLVQEGKPKFVTFAKTLHFLCPDLIAPMDRGYTLSFFRKNSSALPKGEREFDLFIEVMEQYRLFSREHNLEKFVDKRDDQRWNLNVPKICDNVIIGYQMAAKKKRR